ncbi:hypothetical protein U0035_17720 [Niabella yanshanensis]|uniref:DUF4252 domain-containing protein n=1 Tax=Niabella yanshanensis TaxID=577386 RepID=A0ABZ0W4S3_9BACT|nr:hypothetical protein [Niabella yanshanensis]WQD37512.1 hypothetical protein U0035_17720 [Niabella yanshanensis]
MKIRSLFILIVVCAGYIHSFAQDYKKTAEQQFMQYTNLIIKKDFRTAAGFIIEDFYSIIPREQMIKAMETVFNMPEFDYQIDSAKVLKVGDARLIDSAHFLKLQYSNILRMKFGGDSTLPDSTAAENEFLTLTMQSKFGEPNVTYDKASGYYTILSMKDVIAKSKNLTDWKFIVMEEDKMPFLKKILPKELLE